MIKSDKLFNATNSLIIGIGLLLIGILMIVGKDWLYINFINIFLIAILFLSIKQFVNYFIGKKKDKKMNFTKCFLNLLFCLTISFFKNIPLSILPIIFGIYLLLNSIIKFISGYILVKNNANGKLTEFFTGFVYLIISIPIIFSPLQNLNKVLIVIGIYIILLGINYIIDFISFIIPKRVKNKLKRRLRITLPSIIEAVIPYVVLNEINYQLNKETYDKSFAFEEKSEDVIPDLEVFVHTSNRGFNRMGHVDLYYNGKVISYGNYDDSSMRFFNMIGDGVIFTTNKEKYIPFCIEHSKKTLFVFGLKLTEKQKSNIDKAINKMFDNLYEWKSPYEMALTERKKVSKNKFTDYASKLNQATGAKFYKFKNGKYKNYFVVGTNCCRLADNIIGKSGSDLLKMNGVITPGAYYEYLNREFQKKNSMVISRKIYNQENVDKKKIQEIVRGFSK